VHLSDVASAHSSAVQFQLAAMLAVNLQARARYLQVRLITDCNYLSRPSGKGTENYHHDLVVLYNLSNVSTETAASMFSVEERKISSEHT
jgi:hypothetical protein